MTTFLLVYRAAKNDTRSDPAVMAAWQTFLEALGGSLVDTGNPIFAQSTLGDCNTDTTVLGGYSIIEAADLDAATALADRCPTLTTAGGVEVGEITPLNPDSVGTTADDLGIAVAAGETFRIQSLPALRVTSAALPTSQAPDVASRIATALRPSMRRTSRA
jgi:hypothetical protein